VILLLLSLHVQAQLIDNKAGFYFGYGSGTFQGKALFRDGAFTAPALYPNYQHFKSLSVKYLQKVHSNFSIGLGSDLAFGYDWMSPDYTDYNSSKVRLFDLWPVIQMHNGYARHGIFNRLKCYAEFSPVIGASFYQTENPILYDRNDGDAPISLDKNIDYYYGIRGAAGVDYSINQNFGLFCAYSLKYSLLSPDLYVDDHFFNTQIMMGLTVKLIKVKRYFY